MISNTVFFFAIPWSNNLSYQIYNYWLKSKRNRKISPIPIYCSLNVVIYHISVSNTCLPWSTWNEVAFIGTVTFTFTFYMYGQPGMNFSHKINYKIEIEFKFENHCSLTPVHALTSTLTPTHLRKAKLMFFYARYPSSALLRQHFPDVKFNRHNTSQIIKVKTIVFLYQLCIQCTPLVVKVHPVSRVQGTLRSHFTKLCV